jgi:hypothetical protein
MLRPFFQLTILRYRHILVELEAMDDEARQLSLMVKQILRPKLVFLVRPTAWIKSFWVFAIVFLVVLPRYSHKSTD